MTGVHTNQTRLLATLIALAVFGRLLLASGDAFSYDYANYISYFMAIQSTDWESMLELLPLTFPYVLIPGGGAFELGFVVLAKWCLSGLDPTATYAAFAAFSVGMRIYAMRRLGLGWPWILAVELYAITLFEANALRAGMALSLTLVGLLLFANGRWLWATILFLSAASQHVQVSLFCLPFLLVCTVPLRWLRRVWVAAAAVPATLAVSVVLMTRTSGIDISKLDDYSGQSSGAVGLNLVSVLSLVFVAVAFACMTISSKAASDTLLPPDPGQPRHLQTTWARALYASIPALSLLLFGTELAAVGDRAWQFSLVILVALSPAMCWTRWRLWARRGFLGLLLAVALVNTLARYPLSNFFSPPLPYERISPLWLVR